MQINDDITIIGCSTILFILSFSFGVGYILGAGWGFIAFSIFMIIIILNTFKQMIKKGINRNDI